MRILHIDQQYRFSGGVEQYVYSLTERLEELGHQVIIAYGIKSKDTHKIMGRNEYWIPGIERTPSFFNSDNQPLDMLAEIITRENPDVIHIHNLRNFKAIKKCVELRPTIRFVHDPTLCCFMDWKLLPDHERICTKKVGVSCFFSGCLQKYRENTLSALTKKYLEINIHKNLKYILVASEYMKNLLIQNSIPPNKIKIIPYFTPAPSEDSISVPDNQNTILFVGLIHFIKGVNQLISALKYVKSDFNAIVIGNGSYIDQYRVLAKNLGLEKRISFPGWVPNEVLKTYYNKASLIVVPSWWAEAFGIVGIEAMAHARPVVAFNTGGIPDWLEDGVTGFLVERGDLNALAEKITLLLNNKELARKLGENGRSKVLENYQMNNHLNELLKIYQELKS